MADLKIALRHMLRMLSAGQSLGLPDDELLERFVAQRDEAAFESLLCRHGPMVLNTCRRLLGQLPDAEDAFQATFLVFCRKAKTIARRQSLGSWLHRVALRICLRAKATSQRAAGGSARAPSAATAPMPWRTLALSPTWAATQVFRMPATDCRHRSRPQTKMPFDNLAEGHLF